MWLTVGCATVGSDVKPYEMPSEELTVGRSTAFQAARKNVVMQGWKLVRADEERGLVEALTPESVDAEWITRERWTFHIEERAVRVEMRLEAFADGAWFHEEVVCDSYMYSRERMQLENVLSLAGRPSEGVLVATAQR